MRARSRRRVGSRKARPAGTSLGGTLLARALLAGTLLAACTPATRSPSLAVTGSGTASARAQARYVRSNIARDDYAGSAACGACHADVVARWRTSPMHRMTRDIGPSVTQAPFGSASTTFKGDTLRLVARAGRPVMELTTKTGEQHAYLVKRVIGGRYREDFAGVEVPFAGTGTQEVGDPRHELILPVSYVYEGQELRPKGYSVMVGERPGLHAGGVWNETCVFCHNTVPWLDTALGAMAGPHAPGYQGVMVDRTLPAERQWSVKVRDVTALQAAVAREVAFVSGAATASVPARVVEAARVGALALRENFQAQHFVEEGIGCESCHGGSREHVDNPHVLPSFAARAPFLTYAPGERGGPAALGALGDAGAAGGEVDPGGAPAQNRVCARCHQVLFSRYPYTWEGGLRRGGPQAPGGSSITSGEARDLLLSNCGRALTCTTCHDPHGADQPARLAALATPAGNHVCTTCHAPLAPEAALALHAHHDPKGAGGSCVACHMPQKNTGLGYALTRYHRLGSPVAPERVERDRPLECALCHADASVRKLLGDIQRLWGKTYDARALQLLYGDLDRNALEATVKDGRAHEQIAAAMVLADKGIKRATPAVAHFVASSAFPLARRWGLKAVERLLGHPCQVDVDGPPSDVAAALARCDAVLARVSVGPDDHTGAGVTEGRNARSPSSPPSPSSSAASPDSDDD